MTLPVLTKIFMWYPSWHKVRMKNISFRYGDVLALGVFGKFLRNCKKDLLFILMWVENFSTEINAVNPRNLQNDQAFKVI